MRTLFSFLIKYYFFIIFLLLEIVCFILIYSSSYYQRYDMVNTTNGITGGLNNFYSNFTEYFRLKRENEKLASENAFLRSLYKADTVSKLTSFYPVTDTAFKYISAKVISNSINKRNNYFMIDKGENHGIKTDMGVVSPDGVAGIIIATSSNFSTAMSVLHKDLRVSGKILKNGQLASISWDGRNYRQGLASDIPSHIKLNKGDTIITSGHSLIFPEGIPIAYVEEYRIKNDQLFNEATLILGADFNNLYYVYVIENMNQAEMNDLSVELKNE